MTGRGCCVLAGIVGLAWLGRGCGGPERRPSTPSTPPPAEPASVSAGAGDAGSSADAGADAAPPAKAELHPVEPNAAGGPVHVEILAPIAEQRVLIPKAPGFAVRLAAEPWPAPDAGSAIEVALDDGRPRPARRDVALRLGELLPEGRELTPGPHWLLAAALGSSGEILRPARPSSRSPFAAVRFWVGERDPSRLPEPRVFLFQPRGTYNGDAMADRALIDFLALPTRTGVPGGRVAVTLRGEGATAEARLDRWQPLRIAGLGNGDFEVEVALQDPQGQSLSAAGARARRGLTVNRDAPGADPPVR